MSDKIIFANRVYYFLSFKRFLYQIFCVRVFLLVTEKNLGKNLGPLHPEILQCVFSLLKRFFVRSLQLDHARHNHVPKRYQYNLH